MTGRDPIDQLLDAGLVAILRTDNNRHLLGIAQTLVDAGITALEVTLTTPDAVATIAELSRRFDPPVIIGAGTVLTAVQAAACIDVGARFLVSPTASPDVAAAARAAGVGALPGTFTPTEIVAARAAGARAVKLFPAAVVGPRFIRELHGPLPDVAVVPSGGIGIADVSTWFAAGAAAVGLGGALLGDAATDGDLASLGRRARQAVAAAAEAREGT